MIIAKLDGSFKPVLDESIPKDSVEMRSFSDLRNDLWLDPLGCLAGSIS